jgi:dsRNA-specific ribonuclease
MKYFQKMYNGQYPKYIEEESQDDKIYRINIFDPDGTKVGHGYAKSKKEAEQRAAKQALYTFGIKIY